MTLQPLLGADPEIFVVNNKDVIVSASNVIEGKEKALHGEVVNDGMQIELHPEPAHCRETLTSNICNCLTKANEIVKAKGFSLTDSFTKDVPVDVLKKLSSDVQALGCEPDYSAYSGKIKILNIDGSKHFKRYCGGHIHLGLTDGYRTYIKPQYHDHADEMSKMFDYLVGNTFVLLDHDESNVERRKVYGQAGSYRLQPHGIEYRVLSNFWMRHSSLVSLVFRLARLCTYFVEPLSYSTNKDFSLKELQKIVDEKDIEKAINDNDYKLAKVNFKKLFNFLFAFMKKDGRNFENLTDIDLKYILYLNKYPERSCFFDKSIIENWHIIPNKHVVNANFGWQRSLDIIISNMSDKEKKDIAKISLN